MTTGSSNGTTTNSSSSCSNSTNEVDGIMVRRGPWTLEEDNLLIHYISCHGEGRWNSLAKSSGLNRTGKSCRLRWLNYLKPDIKRGNLTPQEQLLILELHSKWGNRWSKIAQHLPGRTDNEIKNYWRTRVQKQARQLKVDSNSDKFVEAIRMYWMPRLVEKMEQNSMMPPPPPDSSSPSAPLLPTNPTNSDKSNNNMVDDEVQCYHPSGNVNGIHEGYDEIEQGRDDWGELGDIDWFGDDTFWNSSDDLWQFTKGENYDDVDMVLGI